MRIPNVPSRKAPLVLRVEFHLSGTEKRQEGREKKPAWETGDSVNMLEEENVKK